MNVYDNIKRLCEISGTTLQKVEKACCFGSSTISKWAKSSPSIDKLCVVADLFNVSLDFLASRDESFPESILSSLESECLNSIRNLNSEGQEKVIEYINLLVNSGIYKKNCSDGMVEKGA